MTEGKFTFSFKGSTLFFFFFGGTWGLNSGLHAYKAGTCKAGTLLLEPHLQSILVWLFGDGVLQGIIQTGLEP
jgi:hypothetical protein